MRVLPVTLIVMALLAGCGVAPQAQATIPSTPTISATATAQPSATATAQPSAEPTAPPPTFVVVLAPPPTSTTFLPQVDASAAPTYTYNVIATYPHDPFAWTQGLVYTDGVLYEGTGLYGQSSLRRVNLETGVVEQRIDLPPQFFGEGIAVYSDTIAQVTWQSQTGFVYDRTTFEQRRTFSYSGEGWGFTYDGQRLIMSDGTNRLRFLDPSTLEETGSVAVFDGDQPVSRINELEYIDGAVYGNIYTTDRIVRIDPLTGKVTAWIDLSGLLSQEERASVDVLNGIAYDAANKRLLVTGKLWPKLFAIELVPQN